MSLPGKSLSIGGYSYHVSDQGAGDKVAMLVHGMPDDGSCWKYQVPALLKAGYRVIVPDTLGYGRTDRPAEVTHYQIEKIIGHMFEIAETLKLQNVNLVGHDWGAAITWSMALMRPELFRKHIAISVGHVRCFYGQAFETPERMREALKENWYMYMHCLEGTEELYMANDFALLRKFLIQHPERDSVIEAIKQTGRIQWLNYDRANPVPLGYLAYARDREVYPNCAVPTMVIFPEDDAFLWKTQAIDTPRYMDAECRVETVQGGHWVMLDHPDDVNKRMLEWFESEPSTARAEATAGSGP
ncbi:alpha/beta fold hydrolase [Streptomyces sp. NPDC059169]|uniref:alpha/beta fold hydrolase n=1 Tax=Streptomyces sp. NPDC059169 TaxID=3346754 RepID=UPI00368EF993